jgi:phage/plasmid-like protein (TIGR03299 family)
MPAVVETMMYFDKTPWHGLGNKIEEDKVYDIKAGIESSGLGWEVEAQALKTVTGLDVPNRAIVRKTDNRVLGVVGASYQPYQNVDMFNFFQDWLDAKLCHLNTAGSLFDGEKIWVLAGVNSPTLEIVKGDAMAKFILLSNSHDGKNAVRVGFTPIRVVCANTLAMAHGDKASKLIRVRHSSKVKENVDKLKEIMNVANAEFEATAEQYRLLASRPINTKDLEQYVKVVFGYDKEPELSTKAKGIIKKIIETVETGIGQNTPARGTYWWAYNGVNNYMNYKDGRNSDNIMGKLWFGTSAAMNQAALQTALSLANAA